MVKDGKYTEFYKHSSKLQVYARENDAQKLLVACSYSENAETFKAPKGFDISKAKLIVQNYADVESNVLKPYETRVYLWNK